MKYQYEQKYYQNQTFYISYLDAADLSVEWNEKMMGW